MILSYRVVFLSILLTSMSYADVILDGTLGPQIELPGPNFAIEAKLGQQYGSNLFHSFNKFNLNEGEIATFSGPNSINTIISRVTGGEMSNIDGTLHSTIPNADMYFLNPHGIMFGPNAKLNISGSFHASTADYLRLQDMGQFNARTPNDSILTVAPVQAFGFLTDTPAKITLQDTVLSVTEDKNLSLVGGDITMSGKLLSVSGRVPVFAKEFTTQLIAPNGRINLASVASKGEVIPTELGLNVHAVTGDFIIDHSKITTTSVGGGDIFIRAGLLKLINSDIVGDTIGEQPGGIVDIKADTIILDGADNYSYISSTTFGSGNGGKINLSADYLYISNGAVIFTGGVGNGNAGSIYVDVAENLSFSGKYNSEILTPSVFSSATLGIGQGGNIEITAQNLILTSGSQIGTGTFSSGKSGNVTVKVTDTITISGKDEAGIMSGIYASTQPLIVNDSTYNTGDAGRIDVTAWKINLSDGGIISTRTMGLGDAGIVNIKTNKLTATGGSFSAYWGRYLYSGISSTSTVADEIGGNAGDIIIDAGIINLINGGEIATSAANAGGGNIEVTVKNWIDFYRGQLTTSVMGGIGNGGNITVTNPMFTILNHGKIKAQADAGNGGNIYIKTDNYIKSPDSLVSASSRSGLDGKIIIDSPNQDLEKLWIILPAEFIDASKYLGIPCGRRVNDSLDSFIVSKGEGSYSLDDLLPSGPLLSDNLLVKTSIPSQNLPRNMAVLNIKAYCQNNSQ
ncbi:MAG: filamentous hemagglutinin N-terminal domain-containing protein [Candidatus Marithrix sp.]|nr:filamentous hemagglutinin N-terminal domain-containing protein [Candidatus Marithrix sp.]